MEHVEYTLMHSLEDSFWWYRALHTTVAQRLLALPLQPQARVLDAGCGTGGMLAHLQRAVPYFQYTGLEWYGAAAQLAENKTGLPIVRGSVNAMPFADGEFAAVLSQDVLYHRNVDERAMLRECHRCLQSGGHLLLNVAAFQWMASAHDEHVHGARRYNAKQLRALLQETGFEVEKVGYWNSLLFPLMALQRLTVGKHKANSDVANVPAWQNRAFHAILDCERRWQLSLPFGGSVWIQGRKR
jgi:SAM-dependent methyltransferase